MIFNEKLVLPASQLFPLVEDLLSSGMEAEFIVTGRSMWPLIRHGRDSVKLVKPGKPVRRGDIVLLKLLAPQTRYILHRVYRINGNTLTTLGDGSLTADPPVSLDSVIGQVTNVYRGRQTLRCDTAWSRGLGMLWMFLLPARNPIIAVVSRFR